MIDVCCTLMSFSEAEIPKVSVPKLSVLQHGETITIPCNLTEGQGSQTPLTRISWFKNGVQIQSVRNPDPKEPKDSLGPLELTNVGVRDGGEYKCLLEVKLRNRKKYNVSDTTMVRSKFALSHITVHWGAGMAQWLSIRLPHSLPPMRPGFDSRTQCHVLLI